MQVFSVSGHFEPTTKSGSMTAATKEKQADLNASLNRTQESVRYD
jgi:hypothetical protein